MNTYEDIPKVELHLHLDGSLNIQDISNKYQININELKDKMIVNEDCTSLNDYLTKFDYPISIMQTKEELTTAIVNLLNTLKKQNIIYSEIRFAPQLHTNKGLTQDEVVKTVIDGMNQVNTKSNLILCFMRGSNNMDLNYETLEVARKYFGHGVCAVDLAGAEALYSTDNYEELFKKTKEYDIPFTIHAGEADGPESIRSAIKFGASRIGHGIRAIEDSKLIEELINKNITLEICPTSNIQTGICTNYSNHPIEKLYRMGVKTTINTDNMTVSNITLSKEYDNIITNTNLTIDDIYQMNINAINSSFISEEEKEELLNQITNY